MIKTSGYTKAISISAGDFEFTFALSSGWRNDRFATNVFIDAPRGQNSLGVSVVINEEHRGFNAAFQRARQINSINATLASIALARRALLDYSFMTEDVHVAVIGNMGRLMLAHAIRATDISYPDILTRLVPVAQEYDARTTQQLIAEHASILSRFTLTTAHQT